MSAFSAAEPGDRIVRDATCAGCGCACDDIELTVGGNRIVEARHACEMGRDWFVEQSTPDGTSCLLAGRPAGVDEGIERAAQLLAAARYPLVYGLEQTDCEAVRLAVGIADWIGAVVDTASGGLGGMSFHAGGEATCSLGEIANRADLVLVWRANPMVTHPRHFSKYSLAPRGRFVPGGRAERTCVVIDASRTKSAEDADLFLALRGGCDFEALWILRALLRGAELSADEVLAESGVSLVAWQNLCDRLKRAKFAVILFDSALAAAGPDTFQSTRSEHWFAISMHTLGRPRRPSPDMAIRPERQILFALGPERRRPSLARGYPRFNPGEYSAEEILARGEADAALIVAADPNATLSPAACKHLAAIGRVTIASGPAASDAGAAVSFVTAAHGRAAGGTVFRMDGVPLPLRPALVSPHPSDAEILARLESRVKQLCAEAKR